MPTDWDGTHVWRAVGINPLLRLIWYRHGGALIPHYDAPFVYHEGKRTLASVILYLQLGGSEGGATRIEAPEESLPAPRMGRWDLTVSDRSRDRPRPGNNRPG
ncbi:MAG: hypothetical protein JWL77_3866 [Chthonomonadaceae bacterium]|nr:hypothetical protein [Chthonomonadaceae bacterium]